MIGFSPRSIALDPVAAVGFGPVARTLAKWLLLLSDDRLGALRGVAGDGLLAIVGESEVLPWVEGIAYLGRDPGAPRLLLPTSMQPLAPLEAFERAIARHASPEPAPWAVLAAPPCVFSMAGARMVQRERLKGWLEPAP
jgi:hypothetical protein